MLLQKLGIKKAASGGKFKKRCAILCRNENIMYFWSAIPKLHKI